LLVDALLLKVLFIDLFVDFQRHLISKSTMTSFIQFPAFCSIWICQLLIFIE